MAEYYKHEIAKWNVATDDLTLEQEAAYHRVVSQIRLYERPFRHNLRVLSGLWRCNERKAKRLLSELVAAKVLTIEGGLIVDEKAVNDASTLRQSRIDKQSAGRLGGINSGNMRSKSLKSNDQEKLLLEEEKRREEKRREEKNRGGGSACAREATSSKEEQVQEPPPSPRERILEAVGTGPDGIVGPSKFLGGQGDMAEVDRWLALPGITIDAACAEIRRVMAGKTDGLPSNLRYFTPAMTRLSGQLTAPALTPVAPGPPRSEPTPIRVRAKFPSQKPPEDRHG